VCSAGPSGGAAVGALDSAKPNDFLVIALQVLFITLITPLIQSEPIDFDGQLRHWQDLASRLLPCQNNVLNRARHMHSLFLEGSHACCKISTCILAFGVGSPLHYSLAVLV
jgi:hypothetical protein